MEAFPLLGTLDAGSGTAAAVVVFFALLIGHSVADFALQGEFLSTAKNRHAELGRFFNEKNVQKGIWVFALGAHSLIHAGAVWVITGSVTLGLLEGVLHWIIDFAKCEGWTSFRTDQLLHIACKATYAVLIACGCGWITWAP